MSIDLPIWIIEPGGVEEKREQVARIVLNEGLKAAQIPELISIDDVKRRLRKLREDVAANIGQLSEELKSSLNRKYPQVKVKSAADYIEAVEYIKEISGGINTISINNSSIVTQELKPDLVARGFTVINSYLGEFEVKENKILDYWDLPRFFDSNLSGTFDVSVRMDGIGQSPADKARKYMAVLGGNSISAEDTTVFFLQHFFNIHKDLNQAEKVIIVVGLDKLVRSREDAAFQSKCMGIFGMESVLLGIQQRDTKSPAIAGMALTPGGRERELHLIILDNGRTKLLEGKFKELFLCIGCRACNKHCPVRRSFTDVDYIWTPRNYLNQFLYGMSRSIDVCLHCEACRMECPIDIDLPGLMWEAKTDYIAKHGRSFKHKMLGAPESLARLGTALAPVSNRMAKTKLVRVPMESLVGIDRKTTLPAFHRLTFRKWFKKHAG